jgi:hypothetical protein
LKETRRSTTKPDVWRNRFSTELNRTFFKNGVTSSHSLGDCIAPPGIAFPPWLHEYRRLVSQLNQASALATSEVPKIVYARARARSNNQLPNRVGSKLPIFAFPRIPSGAGFTRFRNRTSTVSSVSSPGFLGTSSCCLQETFSMDNGLASELSWSYSM